MQKDPPGKDKESNWLREVSQLIRSGEFGLLIVAIDRKDTEMSPLLRHAEKAVVIETNTGDLDTAFYGALRHGCGE